MMKKRIDWIDITKGVAIILMVIGHTIPYSNFMVWIFSFHMPLFIILSGITYKIPKDRAELKKNFGKYLKKLFLPYALTLLLCTIILVFKNNHVFDFMTFIKETIKNFVWGNGCDYQFLGFNFKGIGAIWFLITLFFSKLAFDYINYKIKQKNNNDYYSLILYSFLLLIGIEIGLKIWLPQGFDLVLVFLFYLYIGYLFNQKFDSLKTNKNIVFIIAFSIWTICLGLNLHIELAMRAYPGLIVSVIESLCGSYCVIEGCKLLSQNPFWKKWLSKIGMLSLNILCIHTLESVLIDWQTLEINIYLLAFIRVSMDTLIALIYAYVKNKIRTIGIKPVYNN